MKNLILIIIAVTYCSCGVSQTREQQFVDWAKEEVIVVETPEVRNDQRDIEPVKQLIGDARLVCLGESRHDIHEQFKLKYRLIKQMIEDLGFRTFILEASLPYSEKLNDFIKTGKGNIDEIMGSMPGWFIWDTEEMKEIILWIREYNINLGKARKVQFFGIDIVAPVYPLARVFDYLQKVDSGYFATIREKDFAIDEFDDDFWPNSMQTFSTFPPERKLALAENFNDLVKTIEKNKERYVEASTENAYELMHRFAFCAQQAERMFSAGSRLEAGLIRDSAMAKNTLWILDVAAKNKKAIVWAHNVHIAKSEFAMSIEPEPIQGMGYLLNQRLNDDMVSIGATFSEGEYPDWNLSFEPAPENQLEDLFSQLDHDYFVLDIRENQQNSQASVILNTPQIIRGQNFEMTTIPSESFDALFFTKTITRVMPCEASMERYRTLN